MLPKKHFLVSFAFLTFCVLFITAVKVQAKETGAEYPLQGKTVLLDPGHGGRDHGYCRKNSVCERDIAMEITKKTAVLLKKNGAKVILTRDQSDSRWFPWPGTESETSLDKRILLAGEKKADIFVSVHCNASQKAHRTGAVVFYQNNSPASITLGDRIQRELIKIPENSKRNDKPGSYYLLNKLAVPAVVVETCYLTHRADKENIASREYREKIAGAIFSGIINYFSGQESAGKKITGQGTVNINETICQEEQISAAPLAVSAEYHRSIAREEDSAALSLLRGLTIGSVEVRGSQALIDVKSASSGMSLGGEEEYRAVYFIVNKALKIPGTESVRLTLNGKPAATLAGHIDISSPFTPGSPICSRIPGGTREGKKAQVAVVIDDFGQYSSEGVKEILSLDIPLTCAVMPNLENTRSHAAAAAQKGYEVIVHLPLQPVRGKSSWLGPGAITTRLSEEEVKSLVRNDFDSVPYAVGFNNHMGSAVTANDQIMRAILQVALEKEFFVLDSRTTDKTRIPALSEELGITCVERTVFLDEVKNLNNVKKQLFKLGQEALKRGKAVGIGHVGEGGGVTARALKEMVPEMEKMGIEFVYLSEMAY
ncbi:MAG: divergent polysaccharide deacetylase family protein [Bacillota bacterium]